MDWFDTNAADILDEFGVTGGGIAGGLDTGVPRLMSETQTSNPFGGEQEAITQARLAQFRDAARAQGIRVDEGDAEAYAQMGGWQPGQQVRGPSIYEENGQRFTSAPQAVAPPTPAPESIQPFTRQFTAPTMEQVSSRPGFQFRLGEGLKALDRRSAAAGTLNLPGTAKALSAWAQDYASGEYDKEYGRALNEYDTDFGRHQWNEGNRYSSQRSNRLDDRSFFESDRGFGEQQRMNNYGMFDRDRAFGEQSRMNDFDIYNTQDNNQWGRTFSLAQLGMGAAGGAGAAGQNYATNASDLITGAGNANAAGRVGSGNAWAGAFGDAANNVMSLAALRRRQGGFVPPNGEYW